MNAIHRSSLCLVSVLVVVDEQAAHRQVSRDFKGLVAADGRAAGQWLLALWRRDFGDRFVDGLAEVVMQRRVGDAVSVGIKNQDRYLELGSCAAVHQPVLIPIVQGLEVRLRVHERAVPSAIVGLPAEQATLPCGLADGDDRDTPWVSCAGRLEKMLMMWIGKQLRQIPMRSSCGALYSISHSNQRW